MLNYLKYRTQLNTFAGNVLNSHRVQCLENSYFLSAHAHGKCSREFEVIMKWWWMRISSVRSNMIRILIEKAVLQINKFVPNYMSDFPKMTKGNTSFLIWDEWAIVGKPRVIYIDSNIPSFITCGLKTMLCSTCLTAYQVKVNLTSSDMLSCFRWHGTAFVKIIYYLTV